jgi:CRISPR system Cascade subunit CasB
MMQDTGKILAWWTSLQPTGADDRATLAKLRRAGTVSQLCLLAETIDFCRRVGAPRAEFGTYAMLAGILATIRTNEPRKKFAAQLGSPPDRPIMSPLRYQRLIQAGSPDEQLTSFRRAILLNERSGNVHDIAQSLLDWTEARRQSWLYDYYQAHNPKLESETSV